jgi:hypothetical protein
MEGIPDPFLPGTQLERLYKRAKFTHESGENIDGTFVLTADIMAPTPIEIAAVEAEVEDEALTRAIETVRLTVRSSGRQRVDTPKVLANKALEKELEN